MQEYYNRIFEFKAGFELDIYIPIIRSATRGLEYSALTHYKCDTYTLKGEAYSQETNPSSRERTLHNDYDRKDSVAKKKIWS
jgi:hypothetical protein